MSLKGFRKYNKYHHIWGGSDGKSVLGSDLYEIEMQFFLLGTFIETRKKYHSREAGNSVNL